MKRSFVSSLAFLILIAIAVFGVSAHLSATKEASSPGTEMEASVSPTSEINDASAVEITEIPAVEITVTPAVEITEAPAVEITETPVIEITEAPTVETNEALTVEATESIVNSEVLPATEGNFDYAWFDVLTEGDVKAAIPNLTLRFYGTINTIDPADLTDIVLTRNGIVIENSISFSGRIDNCDWGYQKFTDFYFKFTNENREPGTYGLTGKYKGVPFSVYNKILETSISDTPANPSDLSCVTWCFFPDEKDQPIRISELVFNFKGLQNSFYQSDLSELKLTLNGQEIPYSFLERVFRYYEYNEVIGGDTSYNLVLNEEFTQSGSYVMTGKYQGIPFTSQEITIP